MARSGQIESGPRCRAIRLHSDRTLMAECGVLALDDPNACPIHAGAFVGKIGQGSTATQASTATLAI